MTQLTLTKHQALGNDFLVAFDPPDVDLAALARGMCDRRRGIGADGLLVGTSADGFDARRDARSRTYCYRLLSRRSPSPFEQGRALWWPHPLDRDALQACAALLAGTHDFTAFTPTQTDHVRFERDILLANWTFAGNVASFHITADAFMRNMVRVLVGTMLEVASGRRTVANFQQLLAGAPRSAAGETAPPHGLYLESVSYD